MGWLLRALGGLGVRWVLAAALARLLARRIGRRTVEQAGEELELQARERLPEPLAKIVTGLPIEAKQIGGSAVVAGRAARGALSTTRRAGAMAAGIGRDRPWRRTPRSIERALRPYRVTPERWE